MLLYVFYANDINGIGLNAISQIVVIILYCLSSYRFRNYLRKNIKEQVI